MGIVFQLTRDTDNMKLRVTERFYISGKPYYAIERRYFGFLWIPMPMPDYIEYESVDEAIEQVKIYMKRYKRFKSPRVFYSIED